MTLGTAIFLSVIVGALVTLYLKRREAWNWRKIALWSLALLVALPAAVGTVIYVYQVFEYRPKRQHEFWGISLGDTPSDVKFKRGLPSKVTGEPADPDRWIYAFSSEGNLLAEVASGSSEAKDVYLVSFRSGKVRFVEKSFGEITSSFPTNLGNLSGFSSLDRVVEELGPASSISRSRDETSRIYSFASFNVFFEFSGGRMNGVGVYDSSTGPVRYAEEAK